jgi:hypothetical protein
VIDHVALSPGGRDSTGGPPLLHHVSTRGHETLGGCLARATSGVPPHEVLWVSDICARRRGIEEALLPGRDDSGGGFVNAHGPSRGSDELSFAPPAFLPLPRADGGYSQLRGQNGLVGVLGSDGVVTALSQHGERLWQVRERDARGCAPRKGACFASDTLTVYARPMSVAAGSVKT